MKRLTPWVAMLALVGLLGAACAGSVARAKGTSTVLRLGVFPNLTHSPALVGISKGILARDLGSTKLDVKAFTSGSEASTAST